MSENLESFLKYGAAVIGSALTTIGGWRLLRFVNDWRKGTTDRIHTSRTADLSTTELQDKLYREALSTLDLATTELRAVKKDLVNCEIRLERSEQCLRDCIEMLREAGRDVTAIEARVNRIHGG